jgi:threonylcarbamoyladenosine tRNA methylthiotransferase MtaB
MISQKKFTAGIYTLGCKVNQYESEAIAEALEREGITILPPTRVCDAYVINTCTVTAESDRKARQFIRRVIAKNPDAYIVVTGCFAQTSPDQISAIEGVDAIVGNSNKLECAALISEFFQSGRRTDAPTILVDDISESGFEEMNISKFDRTRAYVKIEDGCENRCTYCIIPNARGKVRSKTPDALMREVSELVRGGCKEIVLTGIETASYGKDLGDVDLADILCRIDKLDGIGRVRLGSLDPSLIKPEFVEKLASLSCLAPHFHLSLQSGSDRVLALMKRKYNSRMAMRAIELLRERIPNVKFTTDVIVGFPGETEEDFIQTCDFVRKAEFLTVHIFPYSKREGTPAATMKGQISTEEKNRRLHTLEAICAENTKRILEREISERSEREVLFETFKDGRAYGHTDDFLEICALSEQDMRSEVAKVELISSDGKQIFGLLKK